MYELGKVDTSKSVGAWPLSYKKRIYWAAVSQRLRNTVLVPSKSIMYIRGEGYNTNTYYTLRKVMCMRE